MAIRNVHAPQPSRRTPPLYAGWEVATLGNIILDKDNRANLSDNIAEMYDILKAAGFVYVEKAPDVMRKEISEFCAVAVKL
jgi:hypothetical protein